MKYPEGERRRGGASHPAPRLALDTPVAYLKGVGPVRAAALAKLGIKVAGDLLLHVPHRYEDASTVTPMNRVNIGDDLTVLGKVIAKGVLPTRKGLRVFQAVIQDGTGLLEMAWPGQPFLDRTINKDDWLLCTGPVRFYHGRRMQPREYINLGPDEEGVLVYDVPVEYAAPRFTRRPEMYEALTHPTESLPVLRTLDESFVIAAEERRVAAVQMTMPPTGDAFVAAARTHAERLALHDAAIVLFPATPGRLRTAYDHNSVLAGMTASIA